MVLLFIYLFIYSIVLDLGEIGRFRTEKFVEALHACTDFNMIGQFGVYLCPADLVVDKVIMTTKHNDDDQYIWGPQVGGSFSITRDVNGELLGRGTKTTLFLKEDQARLTR